MNEAQETKATYDKYASEYEEKTQDYIEKYKSHYSKKDLVNALKKQGFSENEINKVLEEEYK